MLSLSMSFLLWSWTRSRGSWAIHRRGRAENPQKARIWLLRVQLSVERRRGRNQASMSSMRTGRIDAAGRRASIWVFLSSQNPPCIRAAAPAPPFAASNWQEEHWPRLRLHPSSTFQAAKPEPSRTRAERARAAGPPSSQHSCLLYTSPSPRDS